VEKILVVYDDPSSEQTVRRILEPAGYGITSVPLGPTAMGVFHQTKPGLVVLDIRRPGKPGQDLCHGISGSFGSVPLLVLSAAGDVAEVVLMLALGADDYITKPFSADEFLARVRAAMRHLIRR
jgi:DNA-binding response OmpR family regulator